MGKRGRHYYSTMANFNPPSDDAASVDQLIPGDNLNLVAQENSEFNNEGEIGSKERTIKTSQD